MAAHDVRSSIPLTPQTDPSRFPPYEFREFPKGMNMKATPEYVADWMERNRQTDDNSGKPYWPGGRPVAGKSIVPILDDLNQPMFVVDEDEEREFRLAHPEAITIVSVDDEMQQLRAANERLQALVDAKGAPNDAEAEFERRLKALQDENNRLKAQTAKPEADDEDKDKNEKAAADKPKNGLPPRLK